MQATIRKKNVAKHIKKGQTMKTLQHGVKKKCKLNINRPSDKQ